MRIGFVSLGCPKNLVDGEVMLGLAKGAGHELTADASTAEVIVINTCAFIDNAKEESVNAILEMAQFKRDGSCKKLIVTGCLAERYRDQLKAEIPEIDVCLALAKCLTSFLPSRANQPRPVFPLAKRKHLALDGPARQPRPRGQQSRPRGQQPRDAWQAARPGPATPRRPHHVSLRRRHASRPHDAVAFRAREDRRRLRLHLRVLHHPARCAANTRSREIDAVVREAEQLAAQGVKELLLISQDTTFLELTAASAALWRRCSGA